MLRSDILSFFLNNCYCYALRCPLVFDILPSLMPRSTIIPSIFSLSSIMDAMRGDFSFFSPPFFCYIPPFLMPHFVSCFHTVIGIFLQILSASFKDSNIINGMFQFFPTIFSNIIVALRVSLQLFSFIDATLWDPILIFFMLRSKIFPSTF